MAAQYLTAWNPTAIVAAHTALIGVIDSETAPAAVTIHDADDVLLAEIPLTDPCGTVNSVTGVLTLTASGPESSAPAGGTASYATIRTGTGTALRSVPCTIGATPVLGYCVLNTLIVSATATVELISLTVV